MIKTGAEWARVYKRQIELVTYDGWPDFPGDFNCVPVTREEFLERAAIGSVRILDNPSRVFERIAHAT